MNLKKYIKDIYKDDDKLNFKIPNKAPKEFKVSTAVMLDVADEKIRQGKSGAGGGSGAIGSRSISEVLRSKLSSLPLREEGLA